MLRQAALALLLANGLLLALQAGWLDRLVGPGPASAQREPGRLERQVNPGLVQVVPVAGIAAGGAGGTAADGAGGPAAGPGAGSATEAPLACLEAGPFDAADIAVAERSLRDAGVAAGAWQVLVDAPAGSTAGATVAATAGTTPGALAGAPAGGFLVHMGRYADRQALQRKRDELTRLKVETDELRDIPDLQPGLSLGRFDTRAKAEAAMARLAQQGVRTAQVVALRPGAMAGAAASAPLAARRLRLPEADAALQARLAGLRLPSGPGFLPCAGAGAAVSGGSGGRR